MTADKLGQMRATLKIMIHALGKASSEPERIQAEREIDELCDLAQEGLSYKNAGQRIGSGGH